MTRDLDDHRLAEMLNRYGGTAQVPVRNADGSDIVSLVLEVQSFRRGGTALATADDPRALLAAACKPVGQKAWADAHGISGAYVSDILKGRREPGDKMCDALGIERVVTYRRKQ